MIEIFQFHLRIFWKGFQYLNNFIIKGYYNKPNPTGVILIRHWNSKLWREVQNKLLCLDSVSYKEWLNIRIRVWVCACSSVAGGAQPFCTITFIPKTENRDVKITSFVNQNRERTNVTVVLLVLLFLTLIVVSFAHCCFSCLLLFPTDFYFFYWFLLIYC